MRLHYFQHVDYEGLGVIEDWCNDRNISISSTKFFKNETIPDALEYDILVIMGGPMGVYDYDKYAWMLEEKNAIKSAIAKGKIVIGICLGSQFIAEALGAKVFQNRFPEIGWFEIFKTEEGKNEEILNAIPDKLKVFHWHGDTYDLPQGAKHLFYSEACKNQAFIYENRVLGLQFHIEVKKENIYAMIENNRDGLNESEYIQGEKELLGTEYIEENNKYIKLLLDSLIANL